VTSVEPEQLLAFQQVLFDNASLLEQLAHRLADHNDTHSCSALIRAVSTKQFQMANAMRTLAISVRSADEKYVHKPLVPVVTATFRHSWMGDNSVASPFFLYASRVSRTSRTSRVSRANRVSPRRRKSSIRLSSARRTRPHRTPRLARSRSVTRARPRVVSIAPTRITSLRQPRTVGALLRVAGSQLGYRERRGNRTKFGVWYGANGSPWCAMFVSWAFHSAGLGFPRINSANGFSSVRSGYRWAKRNGRWTRSPKPGDVFFILHRDGTGHTGIVERVHANGTVTTLEGNTNVSGAREGTSVMRKRRTIRSINGGFMRVGGSVANRKPRRRSQS
jgi:CHAP domain